MELTKEEKERKRKKRTVEYQDRESINDAVDVEVKHLLVPSFA